MYIVDVVRFAMACLMVVWSVSFAFWVACGWLFVFLGLDLWSVCLGWFVCQVGCFVFVTVGMGLVSLLCCELVLRFVLVVV